MKAARARAGAAAVALLAPLACAAHGLEAGGMSSGLLHPIGGADHLLAMLGIGIVSAKLGGRWLWLLPATFLAAMTLGFLFGLAGTLAAPLVEHGIVASVLVLGLLTATPGQVTALAAWSAAVLFGLCHGHAHGVELPAQLSPWAFSAGFLVASAGFHVMGAIAGTLCRCHERQRRSFAMLGGGMTAAGLVLAAGAL